MYKKQFKMLVVVSTVASILASSTVAFAAENYTVKKGDYLKKIANQVYGDKGKWEAIYEANSASIKNPNLIYEGQIFTIPDIAEQTPVEVPEIAPAEVPETTLAEASESDEAIAEPVKCVPVGINPTLTGRETYAYTFKDGTWIECTSIGYVADVVDSYGVTYREYRPGANEIIIKKVADYIAQNPDSNFLSLMEQRGGQLIIVTSYMGLWDDEYDYNWNYGILNCEPFDCVYMFVAGNNFDDGDNYVTEACNELFDTVSENIMIVDN